MKLIKLAHPSQVRSVPEAELPRLLAQNWCELKKPVGKTAARQRAYRKRCKELGYKRFGAFMPLELFTELIALRRKGESNAALLMRLVKLARLL